MLESCNEFAIHVLRDDIYTHDLANSNLMQSYYQSLTLSKSAGQEYRFCPKKLQYYRFLQAPGSLVRTGYNDDAQYGTNVHLILEQLMQPKCMPFRQLAVAYSQRQVRDYIYQTAICLIPNGECTIWLSDLLYQFAMREEQRINHIFQHYNIMQAYRYIYPAYREVVVFNFERKLNGIIDRLDWQPDGTLLLWDYKSGKPKHVNDEEYFQNNPQYRVNYDKHEVYYELGFYALLIQHGYIYKGGCYTPLKNICTKGCILFLNDAMHSQILPISEEILQEAASTIQSYFNSVDQGYFPRNYRPVTCCMWCEYYYLCRRLDKGSARIPLELQQAYLMFEA
jgi:hypothetical protein